MKLKSFKVLNVKWLPEISWLKTIFNLNISKLLSSYNEPNKWEILRGKKNKGKEARNEADKEGRRERGRLGGRKGGSFNSKATQISCHIHKHLTVPYPTVISNNCINIHTKHYKQMYKKMIHY